MLALLAAAVTSVALAQGAAENLIPNPELELSDGGAPAFWHARTPTDADRTLEWVTEEPHSGAHCLKITNRADVKSRWRVGQLRDIRLRPGSEARLSGWVRHSGEGVGYLRLYFLGVKGEVVAQPASQQVTGDAPWTRVEVTATVPDEAAYSMAYCENDGTGTSWFDDLELVGEAWQGDPKPEPPKPLTVLPDEFDMSEGLRLTTAGRARAAVFTPDAPGRAEVWFDAYTARYDVTATYTDRPAGSAEPALFVNDEPVEWSVAPDGKTATARGVDLQRFSRVALTATIANDGECRVASVSFAYAGRFAGELLPADEIALPPTLNCYPTAVSRRALRAQLGAYVQSQFAAPAAERRAADLDALKTAEDWRRRQQETRAMLPEILGDFGEKCDLKPRIVGSIERDDYSIEKLTIETQAGYMVPCNFYVPKGKPLPAPGIIFTCGHAGEGNGYHLYHECCLGLVLKGYCVLAVEPHGQGERSEYFDPATGQPTVPLTVSQHHQLLRPLWLVGRSLAGHRTWDLHRAVDYLVTRPEVDPERLGVTGNSGGGQMTLLIMAFDERLDVAAAAHPGGSCENIYLTGGHVYDRRILSLIAPRPCRFIVGADSGETYHHTKYEDMLRFYGGWGADEERLSYDIVDGVHDMKQPKRESAYEWLNRWLDMEAAGKEEPPLSPESVEDLWCTETGLTLQAGSESGRTLTMKLAEELAGRPRGTVEELREAVRRRIGMRDLAADREPPAARDVGTVDWNGIPVRKLLISPEPGVELPAALLSPEGAEGPVVIHVAEAGKPREMDTESLVLELAKRGVRVLSVDVRGIGEADISAQPWPNPSNGYEPAQWRRDSLAASCAYGKTTMLALRTYDVIRCVDWVRAEVGDVPVMAVGEGLGGVWAMLAAAFDERIEGVACRHTLVSYRHLVGTELYSLQGYFWVPGALRDYDLPELPRLIAPRPVLLLGAVDGQGKTVGEEPSLVEAAEAIANPTGP